MSSTRTIFTQRFAPATKNPIAPMTSSAYNQIVSVRLSSSIPAPSYRARALLVALALVAGGCANKSCDVGSVHVADVHEYSGRCGDPPHGTAVRVLACVVMHDDAASGGDWRWRCD